MIHRSLPVLVVFHALFVLQRWCFSDVLAVGAGADADWPSVRDALLVANDGDTILLQPGEHVLNEPVHFNPESRIQNKITFRSEAGADQTTLRLGPSPAPEQASVFIMEDLEGLQVEIIGLTISGGGEGPEVVDSVSQGGGLRILNGPRVRIESSRITGNTAASGGGIYCRNATLDIVDSSIDGNVAEHGSGGGIWLVDGSRLTLKSCEIVNNRAEVRCIDGSCIGAFGGGLSLGADDVAELQSCEITGNHSDSDGGAIYGSRFVESLTLIDCLIAGNTSFEVGGISLCCPRDAVSLEGCLVIDNRSPTVSALKGSPRMNRCTITGNAGWVLWQGRPILRNCIVWGNSGRIFDHSEGGDPVAEYSCIEGDEVWLGEGNINDDPGFHGWGERDEVFVRAGAAASDASSPAESYEELERALDFDLRLSLDSPCLGAGEGGVDMGADTGISDVRGVKIRTIHLAPGVYRIGRAHLAHGASLTGSGADATSVLGTVLGLRTGTRIAHLTVTDGRLGGGVRIPSFEETTISRVVVRDNLAPNLLGGGIHCASDSSVTIDRCRVIGNAANSGGGIWCGDRSTVSIRSSVVLGNLGFTNAAGIACGNESQVELENCLILGNLGDSFSQGTAFDVGSDARTSLKNCTIADNLAVNEQGSILYFGSNSEGTIINSIVWGNQGRAIASRLDENPPTVEFSDVSQFYGVFPGPGNRNESPQFLRAGQFLFNRRQRVFAGGFFYELPQFVERAGDYRLAPDSPLIDAGVPMDGLPFDLAGSERHCGEAIDLGAYENCAGPLVPFRRGDANADGVINVSDVVATILWVFFDAFDLRCKSAADTDDGGRINASDVIVTLRFLFEAGPPPPPPGIDGCGEDPSEDQLGCDSFDACEFQQRRDEGK